MSYDAHKNFAYSLVATAPSPASSGASLVLTTGDGTKFPTPPFNATIWPANAQPTTANAEIVRVTAVSTDTLTITRSQESTSARTVVVGDQISANITAKTLTDAEGLLFNPYKFSAYRNAAYSPASGLNLILDTKQFDTGTNFSTTTGLFTAPVAGFYQFDGVINFNAGGAALIFRASLSKNGSEFIQGDQLTSADSQPHGIGVSRLLQLAANDTVGLWWASSNGGTTGMNVGAGVTGLSGFLVSQT